MDDPRAYSNSESVSTGQVLSAMRPIQVLVLLVTLIVLLVAVFALGYQLRSWMAETDTSQQEGKVTALQSQMKDYRCLQTKERFLSAYLKYMLAKEAYQTTGSDEFQQDMRKATANLQVYINDMFNRQEHISDVVDLEGMFLDNPSTDTAVVRFVYDNTSWPVPGEFGYNAGM